MIKNPTLVTVADEGTTQGVVAKLDFVGAGVSVAVAGTTGTVTVSGGGSGVDVQDEGVAIGTATTLNFVGAGVTATFAGVTATITIAGGGGGTPAGADTQVQYNNAGAFGASAGLTWNDTTKTLALPGVDTGLNLTGITTEPAATATGVMRLYAKAMSGRMMPKWMGPAGVDQPAQPGLWCNNYQLYRPAGGTTGTGSGASIGNAWTSGGTVTHITPASTTRYTQIQRTRWANVVTTTNQTLGIRKNVAADQAFWLGNAAGLGGFFFYCRFGIGLIPAATIRLFVGLTATTTTSVVSSDTVLANTCGLWHDTTDGITVLSMVTKNATTATKTAIAGVPTLAANQGFNFYMYAKPQATEIFYKLENINTGATLVDSSVAATLPVSTAFMQPQAMMSNGTANLTVTTTAFECNSLYVESDY